MLSAPSKGIFSSSWLDPLSGLVFPLLAFSVGLLAVFWAADQAVVRWIGLCGQSANARLLWQKVQFTPSDLLMCIIRP